MAVKEGKKRIQVAISEELYERIDKHCKTAGITKSAYLSLLAAKDLEDTKKYLQEFKGELEKVISKLYEETE